MKALKKLSMFIYPLLILYPQLSLSHVRWFVDATETIPEVAFQFNINIGLTIFISLIYIAVACYLHISQKRKLLEQQNLKTKIRNPLAIWPWYVFFALLNTTLVICLLLGEFLAPNLILPPDYIIVGIVIQAAVLVLLPISPSIVGVALIIVSFLNILFFSFEIAIDYFFEFAFVGMALFLIGPYLSKLDKSLLAFAEPKKHHWSLASINLLRIGLGLQLVTLAVHNKFIDAGYALVFVERNSHYNFMQALGVSSFSNTDFVFSAGIFEALLGILLCVGLATKFIVFTLIFIFTTTLIVSGVNELTGHLPIFGVLLILLLKYEIPRLA